MSKYNEMPKGDNHPNPKDDKEKFGKSRAPEKATNPESSGSQDARRHEESSKHGKQ